MVVNHFKGFGRPFIRFGKRSGEAESEEEEALERWTLRTVLRCIGYNLRRVKDSSFGARRGKCWSREQKGTNQF